MLCQSIRNSSKSPAKASIADSRIQKDLHELATSRWTANCSVRITFPSQPHTNPAAASPHLHVLITPTTGAYAHSSFLFSVHLPSSYPFSPPHVRCLTPCLHPLLSFRTGRVYHPILRADWKPVLSLNTVVFALQLLFHLHDDGGTTQQLTDGDEEVRRLLDGSGGSAAGGLFDVLVQQTLDGGFYFGMHWERNRDQTLAQEEEQSAIAAMGQVEERKEYSPQQRPRQRVKRDSAGGMNASAEEADEADDDARKRRRQRSDALSAAAADDEREAEEEEEEEEADEDDDRHRKHKQPHRHFLHRTTTVSPPLPLLHAAQRIRRGHREEMKERDVAVDGDEDARMTRADSFSFTALQSSLPGGPHSPPPLLQAVAIASVSPSSSSSSSTAASSIYSLSSPNSSARLFALSSSSSSSSSSNSSSPALGSLAAMQRQHAMRTTLGATRTQQPSGARAAEGSSGGGGEGGSGGSGVVRTLSSVMAD